MMAEGAGFKVVDIGVDQSIDKFLAATEQHKPDIIGMSALLTTTMTYMKTVVDGYKQRGLSQKFAIGGAPISQSFADEIGADGYGSDASNAVDLFMYFMGKGPPPKTKSKIEVIEEVKAEREESRTHLNGNGKSKFQILYWQDIPSEVKAWDDFDEVKINLPERFIARIDASAQRQGLIQQDSYSAQLRWSDAAERAGSPQEVAEAVRRELELAAKKSE
jgi:cobalamin-dependent methionine synthase I